MFWIAIGVRPKKNTSSSASGGDGANDIGRNKKARTFFGGLSEERDLSLADIGQSPFQEIEKLRKA